MGNPDSQRPGEHPGGQNYPASGVPDPARGPAPDPTRQIERDEYGQTRGFDGAYSEPATGQPGADYGQAQYPQGEYAQEQYGQQQYGQGQYGQGQPPQTYPGGYQLSYGEGTNPQQPYGGQPPYQGPPPGPGDPYGPGGGSGGSGGNNKKVLWLALAAVIIVLLIAILVVVLMTGRSSDSSSAASTPTQTTTTTAPRTTTGLSLPSEIPSGISIPPIFGGGETTGPNAREWSVEVTGSGSAQIITVGVPDTSLFGSQELPWSKGFKSDARLVTVTVIGYSGETSCKITRDGATVSEEKSEAGDSSGRPLICTASR